MVFKETYNGKTEKSNVIKAGNYTMLFAERYVPKPSTDFVLKTKVIEFLEKELEACMEEKAFHEFVLGLEMAILIVKNFNSYYDDRVLRFHIIELLRDSTALFRKWSMDLVLVGMTHAWLLIENMKGMVAI